MLPKVVIEAGLKPKKSLFKINGRSMFPTFFSEAELVINWNEDNLTKEVGDIVVLMEEGKKHIICHRVVDIKDGIVWTKGDYNIDYDHFNSKIVGNVVGQKSLGQTLYWKNNNQMFKQQISFLSKKLVFCKNNRFKKYSYLLLIFLLTRLTVLVSER